MVVMRRLVSAQGDDVIASSTASRRLERGSRLVCVLDSESRVVLQMPRGNLEVVHPRPLVLSAVRNHLDRFVGRLMISSRVISVY